jgi:hypothetical protein
MLPWLYVLRVDGLWFFDEVELDKGGRIFRKIYSEFEWQPCNLSCSELAKTDKIEAQSGSSVRYYPIWAISGPCDNAALLHFIHARELSNTAIPKR